MEIDMEIWQHDERSAKVLHAILDIAREVRTILTSHQELRRLSGIQCSGVVKSLKALRREGVIATRTSWQGTQITLLRRLQIAEVGVRR